MKDKIDLIFSDLKNGVITEKQAHQQVLDLFAVMQRSEQLVCDCNVKLAETTLQVYCPKCYKTHKMK